MAVLVISYTRVHRPQVRPLVELLRGSIPIERAVFWDDDFDPGQQWFDQMCAAIDAAPKLFVFWCGHAAASLQVRREYVYALQREKIVVPVLFDDTPLHADLADIHGIDLRELIQHRPGGDGSRPSVGVDLTLFHPQPASMSETRSGSTPFRPGAPPDAMARVLKTVTLFAEHFM